MAAFGRWCGMWQGGNMAVASSVGSRADCMPGCQLVAFDLNRGGRHPCRARGIRQ